MSITKKTYFNWSSGKDSALALYYLEQDKKYVTDLLLTTVNKDNNCVAMHGLRQELLEIQADSLGKKLLTLPLPEMPDMKEYEENYRAKVNELKQLGYGYSVFGDIFLEDLRAYREQQLKAYGVKTIFPLWKSNTFELMEEFISLGFKAIIICADTSLFPNDIVGTIIDRQFLESLPEGVDPCGENGEFHTFCFDGPVFKYPVKFQAGKKTLKSYPNPDKNSNKKIEFSYLDIF